MDTGNGKFEMLQSTENAQQFREMMKQLEDKHPNHGGWFQEGEVIEIRGSSFRITSVKPTGLRLRLLKRA